MSKATKVTVGRSTRAIISKSSIAPTSPSPSENKANKPFRTKSKTAGLKSNSESRSSPSSLAYEEGCHYFRRYEEHSTADDLEKAISFFEKSIKFGTKESYPWQSMAQLVYALLNRWNYKEDAGDLDRAFESSTTILDHLPRDYPERFRILHDLGRAFGKQRNLCDNPVILNHMINLCQAALDSSPEDHSNRIEQLRLLGWTLEERWELDRDPADLDRAIGLREAALENCPQKHSDRFQLQNKLGWCLEERWELRRNPTDLDRAIEMREAALQNCPQDYTNRLQLQRSLGWTLEERWKLSHHYTDLHRIIELREELNRGYPPDDSDLFDLQQYLGQALEERWILLRDMTDLNRTIELREEILEKCPHDHPHYFWHQRGLGWALGERWRLHRRSEDLSHSIQLSTTALDRCPESHPALFSYQQTLGRVLGQSWRLHRDPNDLDRSIELYTAALNNCTEDHFYFFLYQNGLGWALGQRFGLNGERAELHRSLQLCEAALNNCPPNYPDHFMYQQDLAWALEQRWILDHNETDLSSSILLYTSAIDSCPDSHPERPLYQRQLASLLKQRWMLHRTSADLKGSIELFKKLDVHSEKDDSEYSAALRLLSFILGEHAALCETPTELDRAIEVCDMMLQTSSNVGSAEVKYHLASFLYQRSRRMQRHQLEGIGTQDLQRCIKLLVSNLDNDYLSDSRKESQKRTLQEALVTLLDDIGTLGDLEIPIPILRAVRPSEHQSLGALDTVILRGLLHQYDRSQTLISLNEAMEFATESFHFVDDGNPCLHTLASLVGRIVDNLVEVYDKSGQLQFLDQATHLVESCLKPLPKNHPQHTVITAFLHKIRSRLVPVLSVSNAEPIPIDGGGFSDIYRGKIVNQEVAMKVPKMDSNNPDVIKLFLKEIHLWRRVKHKFILELLGMCIENDTISVISPWCSNGNCLAYIKVHPELDKVTLLYQVAEALVYLHSFTPTIVHGDIKGENVLIDDNGNALLCDFGMSRLEVLESRGDISMTATKWAAAGTCRFMAPELFEEDDDETEEDTHFRKWSKTTKSDVYAFGCFIFQLVTGQQPFSHLRYDGNVIAQVVQGRRPPRPQVLDNDGLWTLTTDCWDQEPESRPTMRRALHRLLSIRSSPL